LIPREQLEAKKPDRKEEPSPKEKAKKREVIRGHP
jgi:hypothetical protein